MLIASWLNFLSLFSPTQKRFVELFPCREKRTFAYRVYIKHVSISLSKVFKYHEKQTESSVSKLLTGTVHFVHL